MMKLIEQIDHLKLQIRNATDKCDVLREQQDFNLLLTELERRTELIEKLVELVKQLAIDMNKTDR